VLTVKKEVSCLIQQGQDRDKGDIVERRRRCSGTLLFLRRKD
jgi:hypothetical protein